jgi:hypothetical protein
MRLLASFAASLAILVTSSSIASAEAPPLPPRVGLELGFGLQAGKIFCESEGDFCNDFTEAGGLNLNAAWFLSPTFGLTADLWAMSHRDGDFTFTHYVNTVGVKWRPVPILTLTGGIGAAHATLDYHGIIVARATSENGFAIMGAAALDVVRSRRWALSVEARFGNGFYGEDKNNDGNADVVGRNVGVGAGFTFFGF